MTIEKKTTPESEKSSFFSGNLRTVLLNSDYIPNEDRIFKYRWLEPMVDKGIPVCHAVF